MSIVIRPYRESDRQALRDMTVEAFEEVSIDHNIDRVLGPVAGRDWRWRKARHVDEDVTANPAGIFVAEAGGRVVGYVSTRIDREAGRGRIPNLAVDAAARNLGLGRRLIEHALDYFRVEGLVYAVIETMAQNAVGDHLYRACGFAEVARQVHFARRL